MRIVQFALLAWTVSVTAVATAEPYVLDRSHAHVTFTVDHLGYSLVHGQFREFDAEIDFDPENVEGHRGDVRHSGCIDRYLLGCSGPARPQSGFS